MVVAKCLTSGVRKIKIFTSLCHETVTNITIYATVNKNAIVVTFLFLCKCWLFKKATTAKMILVLFAVAALVAFVAYKFLLASPLDKLTQDISPQGKTILVTGAGNQE